MAKADFKVEGLEDLRRALDELPKAVRGRISKDAVRAGAEILEGEIKRRAPVSSGGPSHPKYGHLRDNIKIYRLKLLSRPPGGAQAIIGTGHAFWGIFVEYGRGVQGKGAHPFVRPAIDANQQRVSDAVRRILESGIAAESRKVNRG